MKVKDLTLVGAAAALICIFAPWSIKIGAVPITLATFAIYLTSAVLGPLKGASAAAIYILLGCAGLPVFSGFAGGFQALAGPTGGYLAGYVPLALIVGLFSAKLRGSFRYFAGMTVGTVALYVFGTAWFCFSMPSELIPALTKCVFPFIAGDALKIASASVIANKIHCAVKTAA